MPEIITVIILSVGLAMDAFAVSVCNGLTIPDLKAGHKIFIASVFGVFQGVMPLIGYLLGSLFLVYIESFDHWIAFGLLAVIGLKMLIDGIRELRSKEEACPKTFSVGMVLIQGIATSIDALAVGISLLALSTSIYICASIIAVITFAISLVGVFLGTFIDKLLKGNTQIADIIGGIVLIGIGIKILLEHLLA